jgi:hypothetical protein
MCSSLQWSAHTCSCSVSKVHVLQPLFYCAPHVHVCEWSSCYNHGLPWTRSSTCPEVWQAAPVTPPCGATPPGLCSAVLRYVLRDVQRFMDDNSEFPPCLQLAHSASPHTLLNLSRWNTCTADASFSMKCLYYIYICCCISELHFSLRICILPQWRIICIGWSRQMLRDDAGRISYVILPDTVLSRYSDGILATSRRWRFSRLHSVRTGSGFHPTSYPLSTWFSFHGIKATGTWSWPLVSHLVPRSRATELYLHSPICLHASYIWTRCTSPWNEI